MNDVVERVFRTYELTGKLDARRAAESRKKMAAYIETLVSTGQSDAQELAEYGLAYLKQLHEGPDPRFTGC